MTKRSISRRGALKLGAAATALPLVHIRTGHAAGKVSIGFWDHWVPGGNDVMQKQVDAWAEKNKQVVAMAILDWGGNLIESHAMEGAPMNAIDTALLKAKSALRWRRPTSETNRMVRSGENLAPTFMHDFPQPGALPIVVNGQVVGAMGVSGADGEKCAQAAIDAVFKEQAASSAR